MTGQPGRVPRLYLDQALDGRDVALGSEQAHYLRHVLRLKVGHAVIVFDGRGGECVALIDKLARDGATLRVTAKAQTMPESPLRLHLLQAIAKSEAMDLIVQKATELGVREITPIITEFCVVKLDERRAQSRREHWKRIARSACEQSGRHAPAQVHAIQSLADALAAVPAAARRLSLDPDADTSYAELMGAGECGAPLCILIGPEGGLSERDFRSADSAGFARARLGPRILRVETAAVSACALAQTFCGDLA